MKSHPQCKPALIRLAERIRHLRVIKNITAKQVAADLSVTPEAYRNIEKGATDPSFTTLLLITEVLNINICELMKDI